MTELDLYSQQLDKCLQEFPKLQVRSFGDDILSTLIKKISPGAAAITLYNTIYMDKPLVGTQRGAEVLHHEIVHVRDQHRWSILFFLSYLLVLPIGPSFKAFWEWRAYKEDLRWIHEHPVDNQDYQKYLEDYYCQWVAEQFCSPLYLWMWPFKDKMYNKARNFLASLS